MCVLWKSVLLRDIKVERYDWKKNEKEYVPMLTSTKVAVTLASMVISQGFWPFWLYKDIQDEGSGC